MVEEGLLLLQSWGIIPDPAIQMQANQGKNNPSSPGNSHTNIKAKTPK